MIDFRFGRDDLWFGDLLHLDLSGKNFDVSLTLQEDLYQSVTLGMNLDLRACVQGFTDRFIQTLLLMREG